MRSSLQTRVLCCWLLLAAAAAAAAGVAATAEPPDTCPGGPEHEATCLVFTILIDIDNNPHTGCSAFVIETGQSFVGYDNLLNTFVDVSYDPPRVVKVDTRTCSQFTGEGPLLPVTQAFLPPWPVGIGDGTAGSNVVETYVPVALLQHFLPFSGHVGVIGDSLGKGHRSLLTTTAGASRPRILLPSSPPPIVLDGQVGDWVGILPQPGNPTFDSGGISMKAVFLEQQGANLFFRLDALFPVRPTAVDDVYTTPLNGPLSVPPPGVLQNDQGGALTAVPITAGPTAQGGIVTLHTDGSFIYQRPVRFVPVDTFQYTATNAAGSSQATVTIDAVDTPPAVVSTAPARGAQGVPRTSTVTINFNKPVNAGAGAFQLECPRGSPVPFTVAPAPPGGVASFTLHPTAPLPGGACVVTAFAAQIADVAAGQNPAADFAFRFTTASPVVANPDRFPQTVIGNVSINSSAIGFSVTGNDTFPRPVTITAFDRVSAAGGAVTMVTSGAGLGTFTYDPPAGFQGTDTFTYTIANDFGSSTAKVSLPVAGIIWFINGGAQAGDGRLSSPFSSLAAFQAVNDGAARHPAAGDAIFLFDSAAAYAGPASLLAGQKLIGQDATASLAAITGLRPGTASAALPATGHGGRNRVRIVSSANGINLNRANQVRGLTVGDAAGVAIAGSGFRSLTLRDLSIATRGGAIALSGGALDAVLTAVSSGGGAHGIALSNVTGSFEVTGDGPSDPADPTHGRATAKSGGGALALGSGGTISNAAGSGVSVDHAGRVTLRNVTLSGNGGDGLTAVDLAGLTLDNVLIDGHPANHGLHGTEIANLTLIHTEISGNGTSAGTSVENVRLDHLTGTSTMTGSLIANSLGALFQIEESGADAMALTIAGSQFQDSRGEGEGLAISATDDANVTLDVAGSTFLRHGKSAIHYNGIGNSGGGTVSITGSTFDLNWADVNVFHAGAGNTLDVTVDGNTARQTAAGPHDSSILLKMGAAPGAVLRGKITANQVGSATAGSAADLGPGICALASGSGSLIATIDGNTVRQTSNAIFVGSSEETGGTIDVTITRNDLSSPAPAGDAFGIEIRAGSLPTDTGRICANLNGNVAAVGDLGGIQIDTVPGTTVELQGYGGAPNDRAAIDAFLGTTAAAVSPPAAIPTIQGTIEPAAAPCPVPP